MSEKKPTPSAAEPGKICAVCGKRSYSKGGMHPHCAMEQADAPRKTQLAAEKKAEILARQQKPEEPN